MNQRQTLLCGSLLGLFGVGFSAFGAHALKEFLIHHGRLETYELAARYQFYHALALLIVGLLMEKFGASTFRWASLLIFIGVIFFCGSLYIFSLTNLRIFAWVTPIGGVLLLLGWGSLTYSIISKK